MIQLCSACCPVRSKVFVFPTNTLLSAKCPPSCLLSPTFIFLTVPFFLRRTSRATNHAKAIQKHSGGNPFRHLCISRLRLPRGSSHFAYFPGVLLCYPSYEDSRRRWKWKGPIGRHGMSRDVLLVETLTRLHDD